MPKKPPTNFGQWLRSYRQGQARTQQALADLMGCHKSLISKWELGRENPGGISLIFLANALGLSMEELAAQIPPENPTPNPDNPIRPISPDERNEIIEFMFTEDMDKLKKWIRKNFEEDLELIRKKGHDYAGNNDAMANFRAFGFLGIVVRMRDKHERLKNFALNKTFLVKSESVIDTLRDLRNYAFLAQIFVEQGKQ